MSSTIITSTTTATNSKRNSRFKRYLNEHCYIVDFLSASITIVLCLIILLPRVHESFLPDSDDDHTHDNGVQKQQQQQQQTLEPNLINNQLFGDNGAYTLGLLSIVNKTSQTPSDNNLPTQQIPSTIEVGGGLQDDEPDGGHGHHHDHRFPAGEFLICIGFFVFYCTGLGLARPQVNAADQDMYLIRRRQNSTSTVCCSSTRCPPSVQQIAAARGLDHDNGQLSGDQERIVTINELTMLSPDESLRQQQAENDCVMLLNRHHQHHTHSKHHGHQVVLPQTNNSIRNRRQNYGSTQGDSGIKRTSHANYTAETLNGQTDANNADVIYVSPEQNTTIIVDDIRITSGPINEDTAQWPHSLRLLLFSLVLALVLIFFDMNVLGMIRAVKVFRATSTGALLYVAFFIMLPRRPAGCNSCNEEET